MSKYRRPLGALALAITGLLAAVMFGCRHAPEPAAVLASDRPLPAREGTTDFTLLDQNGRAHQLSRGTPWTVLYVSTVGCPVARLQMESLRKLQARYQGRVRFLLLDPAPQDSRAAVVAECEKYGSDLTVLMDTSQLISESLGVRSTAEAILVDSRHLQIAWRGPVDDGTTYEVQKAVTHTYLEDAIEAVLAQRTPDASDVRVQGCAISYLQSRAAHPVDYATAVAPILEAHCQRCHREGGMGPWAMSDYDRVRGWSQMMKQVLLTKRMPPWNPDPTIGHFKHDTRLSDGDLRTLIHWIDQGAPRGSGPDPLLKAPAASPSGWELGPPDIVVEVPPQTIPAQGLIPYQYSTVPLPMKNDVWIRAMDIRPSNPQVLHHAVAFLVNSAVPDEPLDPRLYVPQPPRYDLSGVVQFFGYFSRDPQPFPPGTARFIPAGSKFRLQLHYTPVGREEVDRPRIGLYLYHGPPPRELKVTSAFNTNLVIPAGADDVHVEAARIFDRAVILYGVMPHMHYRGSRMAVSVLYPDGTNRVVVSVPRYRMQWQNTYFFDPPLELPAGARVDCRGAFDNSANNDANPDPTVMLRFGFQSSDEMFTGYLFYSDRR